MFVLDNIWYYGQPPSKPYVIINQRCERL